MHRLAALLAVPIVLAAPAAAQPSPEAALQELLAAERALSEQAANLPPAEGIASLLAEDGVLLSRGRAIAGRTAAAEALRANPNTAGQRARWRSIRAGVSADGSHGFTLGYLDIDGAAPAGAHRRYLAYWVRGAAGWRVAALKQMLRSDTEAERPALPPVLPGSGLRRAAAAEGDAAAGLIAAEQAFSDRAQAVGIHQSFQEYGDRDATHIIARDGIAVGLAEIGRGQAGETAVPPPVRWSADRAIVAPSGDLGVTIGMLRANQAPPAGQPSEVAFFTVWRRAGPDRPWRYIAE